MKMFGHPDFKLLIYSWVGFHCQCHTYQPCTYYPLGILCELNRIIQTPLEITRTIWVHTTFRLHEELENST
jgi:hypothetical protein